MSSRPWLRRFFGFHSQRHTTIRNMRRSRPHVEVLEDRLAPADFRVTAQLQVLTTDGGMGAAGQQVVFFESGVADYQVLQYGLAAGADAVVLDGGGDGLAEMAAFLKGRHDLTAIHIVSHGAPGALELGTAILDEQALKTDAAAVTALGAALAPHGDLLLWGCSVADGPAGQSFVGDLATASGANVAASADRVGSADLGGTWELKATVGDVHTPTPFSASARGEFRTLLPWVAASDLAFARAGETATRLDNGKVLVTAGEETFGIQPSQRSFAELYDPGSNTWSVASASANRTHHTATLLPNGKVLVTGGFIYVGLSFNQRLPLSSAELYDPGNNTWSATASMRQARFDQTATLLPNGKVLVTGGAAIGDLFQNIPLSSAELYDPATNTWSTAGAMSTPRENATATLLPNGKVLVAGGFTIIFDGGSVFSVSSADLYDPATNTWSTAASMTAARVFHTATLLANGKVLVTGALNPVTGIQLSSAELYDPGSNTWSAAASMSTGRSGHAATLMPDGKVLVADGTGGGTLSSELYDPASNTWSAAGAMSMSQPTATLLTNGKVLVTGGGTRSAELFDPGTQVPPFILTQPTNQAAVAGQTVSFMAAAGGIPPPSVQWQVSTNGGLSFSNIPGANSPTLLLTPTLVSQSGSQYRAVFTNAVGLAISSAATLTVAPAPASHFQVNVAGPVSAGVPCDVTVTVQDASGNTVPSYTGTVHFASADPYGATLPPDYTFTAADAGVHTFAATAALYTAGSQTITVSGTGLPAGAVSAWRGEGNALDSVGGHNGTLQGGVTFAPGEVGQAFQFNGTSGYVRVPDAPSLDLASAVTLEAWINPTALTAGTFGTIIAKSTFPVRNYGLWVNSAGGLHLSYVNGGGNVSFSTAPGLIRVGVFTHVAGVIDTAGGVMQIYVNGQLVASQATAGPLAPNTLPLTIGASDAGPNNFFNGLIDEAAVYNRRLSAGEVRDIYVNGSAGKFQAISGAANVNVVAVAAAGFQILAPAGATAGTPFDLTITAVDRYGNTAASYTGTIHFDSTDPFGATLPPNYTFTAADAGVHTFAGGATLFTASGQTITVSGTGLPAGAVSAWRGEGNAQDSVGTNNGSLQGGVTFAPGEVGQAFRFNGTSGYVSVPNAPSFSSAVTLEAWINPATITAGTFETIMAKSNFPTRNYGLWMNDAGGLHLSYINGSGNVSFSTAPGLIHVGVFTHVAGIIDTAAGVMQIYVNGQLAASQATAGPMVPNGFPLTIGASDAGPNNFFNGLIDEATVYNRGLSAGEVRDIYLNGAAGKFQTFSRAANVNVVAAAAAGFRISAPAHVTSGAPFDVTVIAVDPYGNVATGYRGMVTFSVTDHDPAVVLPADYTFSADDQGTHRFTGEFTLITPGMWTLTAADLANGLTQDVMVTVDA
jgi:N-acetylneuraminic acid mutarotase